MSVPQTQHEQEQRQQFAEQRDTLLPRKTFVKVPPMEGLENGYDLEIPRLTLGRTLRLSRWLDDIADSENVQTALEEAFALFREAFEEDEPDVELTPEEIAAQGGVIELPDEPEEKSNEMDSAFNMARAFLKVISSLEEEQVVEFYTIITVADPNFVANYWESGWGLSAIKAAFQQQGFKNMFGGAAARNNNESSGAEGNSASRTQTQSAASTAYST